MSSIERLNAYAKSMPESHYSFGNSWPTPQNPYATVEQLYRALSKLGVPVTFVVKSLPFSINLVKPTAEGEESKVFVQKSESPLDYNTFISEIEDVWAGQLIFKTTTQGGKEALFHLSIHEIVSFSYSIDGIEIPEPLPPSISIPTIMYGDPSAFGGTGDVPPQPEPSTCCGGGCCDPEIKEVKDENY